MAPGADISGKWTLVADAGGQLIDISVELKQSGSDFTGGALSHLGNGKIDNGKVNGNSISGVLRTDIQGQPVDFKMDRGIDGNKLTGTFSNAAFGVF